MSDILIVFLIITFLLSLIILMIGDFAFRVGNIDLDSQYYDQNGDHIYYDRSLIEKKKFHQLYPHINLRSFSHLFSAWRQK